jgi:type IV pilus assembly protein PilC
MQFVCRYGTENGKVERRIIAADTHEAAVNILKKENVIIYDIKRQWTLPFPLRGKKGRIKKEEFLVFLRELIALLNAGLPLVHSFDILIKRRKEGRFLDVLKDIREEVQSGSSLADAFSLHKEFNQMFTSLVETGEKSGELPSVMERYLHYAEKFDELRRKLVSALIYPSILITLSIGLITIMLTYVIPKFTVFYADSERSLPLMTRILIGLSNFITSNILFIIAIAVIAVWMFFRWKDTRSGRLAVDKFKLSLPFAGGVWLKYSLNQFSQSLAVMLNAGIPLLSALEVSIKTITNRWIVKRLDKVIDEVNEGDSLYASLERSQAFPEMAVEMIQVGEQTASLDKMLNMLAGYYERDIDLAIDRALRIMEPIFLIMMGIVIAGMLLAMYLPIFRAGALIH